MKTKVLLSLIIVVSSYTMLLDAAQDPAMLIDVAQDPEELLAREAYNTLTNGIIRNKKSIEQGLTIGLLAAPIVALSSYVYTFSLPPELREFRGCDDEFHRRAFNQILGIGSGLAVFINSLTMNREKCIKGLVAGTSAHILREMSGNDDFIVMPAVMFATRPSLEVPHDEYYQG